MVGILLTVLPWLPILGLSDWGDNYFLVTVANKFGWQTLQRIISSGWVRGAVTGLGILNLFLAGWSIARFKETVRDLEDYAPSGKTVKDVVQSNKADNLPNY